MSIDQILRSELTDQQRPAAVDLSKEVLCLACAGSGKSRTLAYRIARLISMGESPETIVAFTFTEKAADSIKRRVALALNKVGLSPTIMGAMYIGTIHAYCQRILGDMDARYRQFDVLDENRLRLYLLSRYWDLGLQNLSQRANGRQFATIQQISDAWKTANDELLSLDDIRTQDQELGNFLLQLRDRLQQDEYIDFSLMIRNVVEALRSNDPHAIIAIGHLRHLMVDEYQDINPSQEELIRLLHAKSDTLFVVGDDDQAIYAWRGADVSNIIEFQRRYPHCGVHQLSQNFRSTEPIVRMSNSFIANALGPSRIFKTPVAASNRTPQDVRVLWFNDRPGEAQWIAERIRTLLGTRYEEEDGRVRGLTPGDFAILMRSTRGDEQNGTHRHTAFTDALTRLGIPFSLEAGGGPFERPQVVALRNSFELLRTQMPDRNTVQQFFQTEILSAYPSADFNSFVRVLTSWGQKIHRPAGSTRIRLYPQQFVYDLLEAFRLSQSNFDDGVMRDIGLFSRMILDVETVYMSVDSRGRFAEILNFLQNIAESGYDVSTDDILQRPDVVTISTVHKMKGLEFPCVFVADVEAGRFPQDRSSYSGWLPQNIMSAPLSRGAYQGTVNEEARLFYTAITRAERYLHLTGAENLPGAKRARKRSIYALQLVNDPSVIQDPTAPVSNLIQETPGQRIEEEDFPTSFTEIQYYLHCPKGYQFRERYGLNPVIPEMFGYGKTVHTSIQKLHELFPKTVPPADQVEQIVVDTFHLKHVPQSGDPQNHPGAYENARDKAVEIAQNYVASNGKDFERERQVEAVFEIPASNCVITGAIDLLLHEDTKGNIVDAEIIDFKTMEGGDQPSSNPDLDWTGLSLQVQLYARAADQVLGQNAKTGSVHLLKDNKRVSVPINTDAVNAALANIEWAVQGILNSDFPTRPHPKKCAGCDYKMICSQVPRNFKNTNRPPEIHLPDGKKQTPLAISQAQE